MDYPGNENATSVLVRSHYRDSLSTLRMAERPECEKKTDMARSILTPSSQMSKVHFPGNFGTMDGVLFGKESP